MALPDTAKMEKQIKRFTNHKLAKELAFAKLAICEDMPETMEWLNALAREASTRQWAKQA